jgi:hypothetical protein
LQGGKVFGRLPADADGVARRRRHWEFGISEGGSTMIRLAVGVVLLAGLTLTAPGRAALPKPKVYAGTIKDVRGVDGVLTLTMKDGKKTKDQKFRIADARFVGLAGDEIKIGDLRKGDYVEVEMTRDGRLVREVRVVKPPKKK